MLYKKTNLSNHSKSLDIPKEVTFLSGILGFPGIHQKVVQRQKLVNENSGIVLVVSFESQVNN